HVYVILVVMVGWVFFRADSLGAAIAYLKAMTGLTTPEPAQFTLGWFLTPDVVLALIAGVIGSIPIVPVAEAWRRGLRARTASGLVDFAAAAALCAILVLAVVQCAAGTYNPFIYFRF